MSSLGFALVIPLVITDAVLGVALYWMWASGWAQDDQRVYRKMQKRSKK